MSERHAAAAGGDSEAELLNMPHREAIRQETELLIRRYAGEARPADLRAMARVFEAAAPNFEVGAARLRLWAKVLLTEAALEEMECAPRPEDPDREPVPR